MSTHRNDFAKILAKPHPNCHLVCGKLPPISHNDLARVACVLAKSLRLSVIGGLDYWNGLLEWTTGMDFDPFFFPKS